ncbi:MAG TPA: mechanosensitive ion channel domain-containing protein [Anaerolineae bacterium]|nr:mechanosensitive ion channel domain-containing protein [Anaerolineae bacterium]
MQYSREIPPAYLAILAKGVASVIALVLMRALNGAVGRLLQRRFHDSSRMHTLRMVLRNGILFVGSALILFIWIGFGNFAVFFGILGAGIAFASQEVIGSVAGYLNIVTGNLYHIGDRVRIGDVVGDVMDVTLLRTTLMEIGEWVKADQYTGRIVSVANRTVFAAPVFNYTQHFRFLWDEITIPITYDSNWRLADELMLEHGREYSSALLAEAEAELRPMKEHYSLGETVVEPTLYVVMTDNWIEMTLRYVVEARKRRVVKAELHRELLEHFEAEEQITVASATFEIVGFPPLRGEPGTVAPMERS